ncbi:DnaJ domain-containing protein, putative [Eimeria tenella]|uniref:DnaJ domain-containing protein, putative n=1 Tax=Eimeria tenella TaxID=5802 RepID=U6L455_EIMTE|nr:DnaJ domain-containing protein, putative [Eimeria tenella]CDJ44921.1 DnaJ domain-containing protein, putative [Eimeria tenella]|eukprot:XP_013235668.1 DnaJ domain-containing protein, putative [Eimeria tenella]
MAPQEEARGGAPAAAAAAAPEAAAVKSEAAAAATAAKTEAAAAKTEAAGATTEAAAAAKSEAPAAAESAEAAAAAAKTEEATACKTGAAAAEDKTAAAAAAKTESGDTAAAAGEDAKADLSSSSCSSSNSSSSSPGTGAGSAAEPEKAAESPAAAAGASPAAAAAADAPKGSINYAEQYMKAMGLSSSSSSSCRGFDLAAAATARDLPPDDSKEGETSGFKFPSYEEFLKEEQEEEEKQNASSSSGSSSSSSKSNERLDDAFAAFMTELERIPSSNPKARREAAAAALEGQTVAEAAAAAAAKVVVAAFGTAAAECVRLTSQAFSNPFQVLLLTPEASEEAIRKQYRKLSLLIHPDKCKHELAQEAFQIVNKAYEKLQEEGVRLKYEGVIEEAKKRVLKKRIQENKSRKAAGERLLPETEEALRGEILECCELLLKELKEKQDYKERCRAANEKYEKEKEDKLIEEEKEKCRERNEWVKKREERVSSWREYQEGLKKKEFDHRAFTGLRHVREERKEDDIIKKRQKVQGIDNSYKLNWR